MNQLNKRWACWVGSLLLATSARAAPVGTAITYQGVLQDGAGTVTGDCDFRFTLYDVDSGGSLVAGPVSLTEHVEDGLFTIPVDFGLGEFPGEARWLKVEVCCPSGGCTLEELNPRVELTPTPYAFRAMEGAGPPNTLEIDEATGRIGIGRADPGEKLDVLGVIQSSGAGGRLSALNPDNQNAAVALDWHNDVARIRIGGSGTGAENGLDIQKTQDRSLLRILHNGHVGIGTTSPSQDLHIVDEGNRTVLTLDTYFTDPGGSIIRARKARGTEAAPTAVEVDDILFDLQIGGHDGTPADITGFDTVSAQIRSFATENWVDGAHGADLRFATTKNGRTVAVERMRIDHNGNVGIRTDDPNAALHIDTDTLFDLSSTPASQDNLLLTDNSAGVGQHNVFASIGFGNNENSRRAAIAALQTGTGVHHQGLAFYTHPSGTGSDDIEEKMRIKHNGNVGIGTTNPGGKLHVVGGAGDGSVVLPDSSVSSGEILDESGVSSSRGPVFVAMSGPAIEVLHSRVIDVPASGFVLAIVSSTVSGEPDPSIEFYQSISAQFSINTTSASHGTSITEVTFTVDAGGSVVVPVTIHDLVAVSAGTTTFYFLGEESIGEWSAGLMRLTLVFIPTAY